MLNVQRMNELADAIAGESLDSHGIEIGFNMREFCNVTHYVGPALRYHNDCDTLCCIGGWACLLFGESDDTMGTATASRLLGLNEDQANRLFYNERGYICDEPEICFDEITRDMAVNAIRRMAREEAHD